jgi:hypothetical protein
VYIGWGFGSNYCQIFIILGREKDRELEKDIPKYQELLRLKSNS